MPKLSPQFNTAVSDLGTLNGMTRSLERSEARRIGTTLTEARKTVARRLGITSHTFDGFLYGRAKVVPHWLMERVRAELLAALQLEAQNLEHEIQLHRQTGSHPGDDVLLSAEAQLAATRRLLKGG